MGLIKLFHSKVLRTPIKLYAREEEVDAVIPEEIIDCRVKTEGLHKCEDCDFRTQVETKMLNHTQIDHIDHN